MDLALAHKRLEIGATWLAPAAQRTGANVEAKLLLLEHAFEQLAMQKVVLKTEVANVQSRTAIRALGASDSKAGWRVGAAQFSNSSHLCRGASVRSMPGRSIYRPFTLRSLP